MEKKLAKWGFKNGNSKVNSLFSIPSVLETIRENLRREDERPIIHLGLGDPSAVNCFRTSPAAEEALFAAIKSAKFNGYAPLAGLYSARRSIAEYLSHDLPYKISPDDVFLTLGANQAIEVVMAVFARAGANILLPKPGYPFYEGRAAFSNVEVRHFDLLPEKGWEVDLESVQTLADENTFAIVVINPGNPCGNVFTSEHLQEIAETAKKLGILVIADEVYSHLSFGSKPFVPMGVFGPIAPILTLGSISKRWIVPGWRLGWIVTVDPRGILKKSGIAECLQNYLDTSPCPATIIQGAVPHILEKTPKDFYSNINSKLKEAADICYTKVQEIPCLTCPYKPDGSMFVMLKLNLSLLEGINDDMDFCNKLAHEESVIILPGVVVALKNWLRLTFAMEPASLEDGLERVKAFCSRHTKKLNHVNAICS